MFNKTIFKQTFKANFKIWFIVTMVLIFMNTAIIGVFDPETITSMTDMVKDTPLANMLADTSFLGMLAQTIYSMQGIILILIFIISVGSSLIVSQVDRGSMAYLLSTPIKRSEFVITQVIYFITSLFTMILIFTISGLISVQAFHGGILENGIDFDVKNYIVMNLGLFLLMFATSGITFMFSCIFNTSKNYMAFGAGVPLAFFLFHMMAEVSDSLNVLKYFSLNTLFDTQAIINGDNYAIEFIILLVVGIIVYSVGIGVFKEKDLPL